MLLFALGINIGFKDIKSHIASVIMGRGISLPIKIPHGTKINVLTLIGALNPCFIFFSFLSPYFRVVFIPPR